MIKVGDTVNIKKSDRYPHIKGLQGKVVLFDALNAQDALVDIGAADGRPRRCWCYVGDLEPVFALGTAVTVSNGAAFNAGSHGTVVDLNGKGSYFVEFGNRYRGWYGASELTRRFDVKIDAGPACARKWGFSRVGKAVVERMRELARK